MHNFKCAFKEDHFYKDLNVFVNHLIYGRDV